MALIEHAKHLRREMTDAEARLWYYLRGHHFLNLKFKRQKPIGPYIVDFVCLEHFLVIELDGGQHLQSEQDRRRDQILQGRGYRVLRFWNHDVLTNTQAVLEAIRLAIEASSVPDAPSPPTPLP